MRFTVSLPGGGLEGLVQWRADHDIVSDGMVSPPLDPDALSAAGFPVFSSGKRVTSEDVRALIDEDEPEEEELKEDVPRVR